MMTPHGTVCRGGCCWTHRIEDEEDARQLAYLEKVAEASGVMYPGAPLHPDKMRVVT